MDLPLDLELRTDRLLLRPLVPADAALLFPDMADPEVSRWMAWDAHRSLEESEAFVAHEVARREAGRGITFAITEDGAVHGIFSLIGLLRTHRVLTYDRAELAYWLGTAHRRRGLATEAGRAVMRLAFGRLLLHKLHVSHFGGNAASAGLIARLGFRKVGVQRREFRKAGHWYDHHLYELLDEEFAA